MGGSAGGDIGATTGNNPTVKTSPVLKGLQTDKKTQFFLFLPSHIFQMHQKLVKGSNTQTALNKECRRKGLRPECRGIDFEVCEEKQGKQKKKKRTGSSYKKRYERTTTRRTVLEVSSPWKWVVLYIKSLTGILTFLHVLVGWRHSLVMLGKQLYEAASYRL